MKAVLLGSIIILFSLNLKAKGAETSPFIGEWCGKWDGIYKLCIFIEDIKDGAAAKYRWKEFPHGKFKKATKDIERVNLNTLKIDNIWFVLDSEDNSFATAIGVFRMQTRIAQLKKSSLSVKMPGSND